ncbi:hypothetical protein R1sor_002389 [Riccia sorocarpa]|uniref:Peptidase C14 caspase domain-containing protein n=1 Tax=Riccia sorocarpa TaxID=122646 RepID=A0ABD3H1U8_9MARC
MVKRAVLVGCNYPGTRNQLSGCVNDVTNMRKVLTDIYGFDKKDILFMVDTDHNSIRPTAKNITKQLGDAIKASKAGDVLYFHFSGHGGQIPAESGEENDGEDEAIYPTDLNPMTDDSFRVLLSNLDPRVTFTFVSDSCNSGGLLDNQVLQVGVGEDNEVGPETESTRAAVTSTGSSETKNVKSKELPVSSLIQHLSEVSGHEVDVGTIRVTLYELFKHDASPTVKAFVKNMTSPLEQGIPEAEWSKTYNEVGISALTQLKKVWDDENISNEEYFHYAKAVDVPLNSILSANATPAGQAPPASTAILVSGCESDQLSADVPSATGAFGALSHAVETVVRKYKGKVTNKKLVNEVRALLVQEDLDQRPCLYCTHDEVNLNFITGVKA